LLFGVPEDPSVVSDGGLQPALQSHVSLRSLIA